MTEPSARSVSWLLSQIKLLFNFLLIIALFLNTALIQFKIERQNMAGLVFIFVYYLGKPIFVNFGVSDRNRCFTALIIGAILDTTVFALYGPYTVGTG